MVPERERVGDREREGEGEQADLKRQSFPAIQTVKALNSSVDGDVLGSRTLTARADAPYKLLKLFPVTTTLKLT